MTPLTASLVWCVIQVTLFSAAVGLVYLATRRLAGGVAGSLLAGSLALVLVLTLLAGSPWPRWDWRDPGAAPPADAGGSLRSAVDAAPRETSEPPASAGGAANQPSPYAVAWEAFTQTLTSPQAAEAAAETSAGTSGATFFWSIVLVGFAVSTGRLVWGVWQVNRMLGRSQPLTSDRPAAILDELTRQLGLDRNVALRESADLATPATVGWRRQHILLPPSWRDWSSDQLRAALAHELSHVAARDYRSWIIARLAVAVHFYHPLVRWLAGRLQLEQELAADAAAARLVGDRQNYLQCLASLALATPHHRLAGPARTLFPSRSLLMRRIEMLRTIKSPRSPFVSSRLLRGMTVGLMAAVALAVAGIRQPAASVAQEPAALNIADLNPPERIPLSVVPANAVFAFSIRPAELLADEAYDPLLREIDELEGLKGSGVSARDLAEVMLILSGRPGADRRIVVRCASPDACLSLTNRILSLSGDKQLKVSNETTVFETPSMRITRLDISTIVVDPKMRSGPNGAVLPPLQTNLKHPWAEAWNQFEDRDLVVAANVLPTRAAFQQELKEAAERGAGIFAQSLAPVIDHTDWAVAGLGLDEKLTLDALAECDSDEHAQQVAGIVQALIQLSAGMVGQQEAEAYRQMENQASAEEIAKYRPLVERVFAIGKDFTTGAKPTAEGNTVKLTYSTDALTARDAAVTTTLLLPAVKAARAAAMRNQSTNDLKQIALAMHNYADKHGHFPPAVLYKEGSPHPHSWRVALLPYLEQQALYGAYNFDEPWDSPANRRIAETVVPVFQSPFDDPSSTHTSYFALTGPDTIFSGKEGTKFADIVDGMSKTIMFVEAKREVPWTKPEDIPYAADKPLPELGGWMPGIFLAAFCDGHVEVVTQDTDQDTLRAFITKAGKEATALVDGEWRVTPVR